ncbi:MAG: hypothetical protein K2Q97_05430, partial [Burkholderiaceae bacterium]|nr:hypothetical protein [Burkholderiaceae bacterium]
MYLSGATQAPQNPQLPAQSNAPIAFKVLTVNVHKGFTTFNRRFMLHELRDAVRDVFTRSFVAGLQEGVDAIAA